MLFRSACAYAERLETGYCENGSGWACNELGIARARQGDYRESADAWQRGCALGFAPACANRSARSVEDATSTADPTPRDLPILVRGSKGPVNETDPTALQARACRAGWTGFC